MRIPGIRSRSTSPTPVIVPPVPTPATKPSTLPPVASRISSAVVRRWASGFAGFSNCWSITYPGCVAAQLLRRVDGARHSLDGRREDDLGPEPREEPAPLEAHVVRHREDEPVTLDRRDQREADPRVPAGRLDQRRARLERAAALGVLDHGARDPVLDAPAGVLGLDLGQDRGASGRGDAVQPDQRGVRRSDRARCPRFAGARPSASGCWLIGSDVVDACARATAAP